jgi:hypothetical protein
MELENDEKDYEEEGEVDLGEKLSSSLNELKIKGRKKITQGRITQDKRGFSKS